MTVRDLMSSNVKWCSLDTNLAAAAEVLWAADCGALPVMYDGQLAGVITDRDICIALGTRNRLAAEVSVGEVATRAVETCTPDADVHAAMGAMRRAKVHRLPVVDGGQLVGMLTLNDIVEAVDRKHGDLDYEEVMNTVKAVSEHRTHKAQTAPKAAPAKRLSTRVAHA